MANEFDFPTYVITRLANPRDRFCRNAQTWRLAVGTRPDFGSMLERALCTAERLPFVGCVEAFDASVQVLQRLFAPHFPEFRTFAAYENVLRPGKTLDERLADIKGELGHALYDELVAANTDDLTLHREILARYQNPK